MVARPPGRGKHGDGPGRVWYGRKVITPDARMTPLLLAAALAAPPKPDPSADLFKPAGPVPVFQISVDAENLKALRRQPRTYVKCAVRVGDQTFKTVAIHLKGAAGSTRDWNDKPALTLNFDKFVEGQSFRGLDKLHLNNSVQDGWYLNEIICGELSLAAGLPAARGCHALVELNGRKVGLYVLKEGFDKVFLKRHFDNPTGNLYDGGFLTDIDSPLELDEGKDNGRKDLQALARACREKDPAKRYAAVEKLLDVDRLVTKAVLEVVATDWDGYCRNRNNYRVYFNPKDGKAVFFPHGMDQMFQNPGEPFWHGWNGLVAKAVLETPEGKKAYNARLKEFAEKYFVLEKVHKRVDELAPRARDAIESVHKGGGAGYMQQVQGYKEHLKQRAAALKRHVAKSK
jgi:hypothetical protein